MLVRSASSTSVSPVHTGLRVTMARDPRRNPALQNAPRTAAESSTILDSAAFRLCAERLKVTLILDLHRVLGQL